MDAEARRALAARILERSRADATEAIVTSEHRALTRFTHEFVHQNVDVENVTVRVRAIVDGRTGVASTNAGDDAALDAVVGRAIEIAALAPRAAEAPGLAPHATFAAPPGAYVDATASATPEQRARVAAAIFEQATSNGCWCSGYVTTSSGGITIATSAGADASFDGTECGANVKMTAGDSTGFAERYAPDVRVLDGTALGARAAQKARASAAPVAVEPGEWTVILEPAAFGELGSYLASHFSAQSYDEGSSFLSGRLGERVMDAGVTIRDDYAHPLHPDAPFDYEGNPKERLALIEAGVARTIVTDGAWARKLGRPNTGHGLPAPNARGPYPLDLVIAPGSASLDELIAGTRRGLLVTRLWYVRVVDQRRTILTGMTRDGTFLIEDGKLTHGVRNLRFNQSLVDALGACAFSNDQQRTGGYSYANGYAGGQFRAASRSPVLPITDERPDAGQQKQHGAGQHHGRLRRGGRFEHRIGAERERHAHAGDVGFAAGRRERDAELRAGVVGHRQDRAGLRRQRRRRVVRQRREIGRAEVEHVHDAAQRRHRERIQRKGAIVNLLLLAKQDHGREERRVGGLRDRQPLAARIAHLDVRRRTALRERDPQPDRHRPRTDLARRRVAAAHVTAASPRGSDPGSTGAKNAAAPKSGTGVTVPGAP